MTRLSLMGPSRDDTRFLSKEACRAVADRIFAMGTGGGETSLTIDSTWNGELRWGRNTVVFNSETESNTFHITRSIRDARGSTSVSTDAADDDMFQRYVKQAEAFLLLRPENPDQYPETPSVIHPYLQPVLWFDTTYNLDQTIRGKKADVLIAPAAQADLLSAGYIQVAGRGKAVIDTKGLFRYYPYTTAEYSVTVRDHTGSGSGWAGVDWNDWSRINAEQLSATALEKCKQSRNPVAVEPGHYTVILEPQAVCDFVSPLMTQLDRIMAEGGMGPFAYGGGDSKIGQQVIDTRLTLSADPMDPDCGFVPFDWWGEPYRAVNWIEHGILKELSYPRDYGVRKLGKDWALPNSGAFHLSGGTTTIDEMIATTKRGVIVTRFNNVRVLHLPSMLSNGNTRDGLWLIEHGKTSKPIKNFRFTDSPLFALNNLEQLGVPQRVFHPIAPVVVPALKVRDFNFSAVLDAV